MAMRAVRTCGGESAVRKGPWTLEEDLVLVSYISEHGEGSWDNLARAAGLNRNGKSCRLRWLNYLRPGVRRGSITPAEDAVIRELQATLGNKWSKIAKHLPGRTDNEIKNYWRTRIKKRLPTTTTVSDGASSSSSSRSASHDSSAVDAAGDCCWFTQHKAEQQRAYYYNSCLQEAPRRAVATTTTPATGVVIKSEQGASSASSAGDCSSWYTHACSHPYSSQPQLSSAADNLHLGVVGVDAASPATQPFFSSDMSDGFWNAVDNFWETNPDRIF